MYCIYIYCIYIYIYIIYCVYIYCIYIYCICILYIVYVYIVYIYISIPTGQKPFFVDYFICVYIYICGNIYVYGKKENMFDTENMTGVYCRYSLISTNNYELVNWVKRKISKLKSVSWSHLFQIKDFDKYVLKMRILPRRHTLHVDGWVRH